MSHNIQHLSPLERTLFLPPKRTLHIFFIFFCLSTINVLIYSNSFRVPFHFDDLPNIVEKDEMYIPNLTAEAITNALYSNPSRPLPMLSFALNTYFRGTEKLTFEDNENTFGFHLVNLFIHIITSFFIFLFLYNTLNLYQLKSNNEDHAFSIAVISAFLWSVNPIHTQAVTYIVQRMASMAAMFYIISMYFYLKGRTSENIRLKAMHYSICATSFFLGLFSKQNVAMLPAAIFFYEFMVIRGWAMTNIRYNLKLILITLLALAAASALILMVTTKSPFSFLLDSYEGRLFTLSERILTQPRIILLYISLLLYPSPDRLNIAHDIALSHSPFDPLTTLPSILAILMVPVSAFLLRKKHPLIAFCILFFFINHIIESSIIALELIFEHRNYLPSMFFFVPISFVLVKAIKFFSYKKRIQNLIIFFIVSLIIVFGHGTYVRNFAWWTQESLWIDAVSKAPNVSRNHINIGVEYFETNRIQKAMYHFNKAIELGTVKRKENRFRAFTLLGDCYLKLKSYDKAIKSYHIANKITPTPRTFTNIAVAYLELGKLKAAQDSLVESLSLKKTKEAHVNLGFVMLRQHKFPYAITESQKALDLDENLMGVHVNLGIAYKEIGHYKLATQHFKKVLAISPKYNDISQVRINAYFGLIECYLLIGNREALISTVDQFVRLTIHLREREFKKRIAGKFYDSEYTYHGLFNRDKILLAISEGLERMGYQIQMKKAACLAIEECPEQIY